MIGMLRKGFRQTRAFLKSLAHKKNKGYCLCCEQDVTFVERGKFLRADYRCSNCRSVPRNRALLRTIQLFAPAYRELVVHESSPGTASSRYLKKHCKHYSDSQFFPGVAPGSIYCDFRCENLEQMTFDDAVFDLFITSDVFEHVMDPEKAFAEIARVLKPGGLHIFTIPWYPKLPVSRQRARLKADGAIEYLEKPEYHGNPVSEEGSLVTMDWGLDFCDRVFTYSGMTTTIYLERDRHYGLDGTFLEVFVSRKPL